jgi:hypothetical protein
MTDIDIGESALRHTRPDFQTRVRRQQVRADSHLLAEGIEYEFDPDPFDLMPSIHAAALSTMNAAVVLKLLQEVSGDD